VEKADRIVEVGTAAVSVSNNICLRNLMKIFRKKFGLALWGLFGLSLVACGGAGGGGSNVVSNTDSVQSDDPEEDSESSENRAPIICWHGKAEYEFLVAYPPSLIESGIGLTGLFTTTPWDNSNEDLANDSLKMCSIDNQWYGEPDPNPWFPKVSFLQLSGNTFVACENSFPCGGESWNLEPGLVAPLAIRNLSNTNQTVSSPTIIGYERTDILF